MGPIKVVKEYLKESFILYKPKDVVAGDFYWMEKIGSQTILALSDCTGHGVPGSFMSLLGINLLNSIIHEGQFTDPGKILNELDRRLIDILPKGKGINLVNDGMEITICVLDDKSNFSESACLHRLCRRSQIIFVVDLRRRYVGIIIVDIIFVYHRRRFVVMAPRGVAWRIPELRHLVQLVGEQAGGLAGVLAQVDVQHVQVLHGIYKVNLAKVLE